MRCQEGNVCKRPPAPSSPPQENWKTCNGEIWTITTVEHTIFIENNNGCAVPAGFIANSLEDALECARNIHGEDVIGPTVGSSMFAVTCPTIGCTQMYRSGRDQDGARDCIEAEFPTCDVEDGPCP
jgi:hypothetical protein